MTSCNFNFYPGALVFFRKYVVRALELGFYTSRRCTMQLNQTQPSPLTVLLQLNFCYQVQTTVVSTDAHPSNYSSVATTLYPTFVFDLKFLFPSPCVETVNNKCMKNNAIPLYVSHSPAYLGNRFCYRVWTNDATSLYVKHDNGGVIYSGLWDWLQ